MTLDSHLPHCSHLDVQFLKGIPTHECLRSSGINSSSRNWIRPVQESHLPYDYEMDELHGVKGFHTLPHCYLSVWTTITQSRWEHVFVHTGETNSDTWGKHTWLRFWSYFSEARRTMTFVIYNLYSPVSSCRYPLLHLTKIYWPLTFLRASPLIMCETSQTTGPQVLDTKLNFELSEWLG